MPVVHFADRLLSENKHYSPSVDHILLRCILFPRKKNNESTFLKSLSRKKSTSMCILSPVAVLKLFECSNLLLLAICLLYGGGSLQASGFRGIASRCETVRCDRPRLFHTCSVRNSETPRDSVASQNKGEPNIDPSIL